MTQTNINPSVVGPDTTSNSLQAQAERILRRMESFGERGFWIAAHESQSLIRHVTGVIPRLPTMALRMYLSYCGNIEG